MARPSHLLCLAVVALTAVLPLPAAEDARPPNLVLIMADDLGHECLGAYGGTSYRTPRLDRLAAGGARFTNVFSTPKCSPSRLTLLTGRYTFRTEGRRGYLPPDEITFGHLLRDAGYATALAGKWQLGHLEEGPASVARAGFRRSCCWAWEEGPRYWRPLIWQDGEIRRDVADRYGPDVYSDYLVAFIEANRDRPFLVYYPMTLTHEAWGMEVPGPEGRRQTYAEMVEIMDALVGKLVQTLDRLGLRERTLVLFTADNGSPRTVVSQMTDRTVRGGKNLLTDAGTRVPLIANWPGTIAAGTVIADLVDFSDFLPTLAELGGAALPTDRIIDGRSFAGRLQGRSHRPRAWVYTTFRGRSWVRDRDWKLYGDGTLFDMRRDVKETDPIPPRADTRESSAARAKLRAVFEALGPESRPRPE